MNILLLVDDYLPHSTKSGARMMHDLATELVEVGHSVFVVTPASGDAPLSRKADLEGVTVAYFKAGKIKGAGKVQRAINELLLSNRSWKGFQALGSPKPDLIVYYSPSIFWGPLVTRLKRKFSCPSFLVLRDLFPQWAIDSGLIKKGSLIERFFRRYERLSYQAATRIGLQSDANLRLFCESQPEIETQRLCVLYNWIRMPTLPPKPSGFREFHSLAGKTLLFYGGNIGSAQDIPLLMELARRIRMNQEAIIILLGSGDKVEYVKKTIMEENLTNVRYYPSVSQASYDAIVAEMDIGLFTLAAQHSTHNFPGKLLGYMANGLPILGSVNKGNDVIDVLQQAGAGLVTVADDLESFFLNAKRLIVGTELRVQMGIRAKELLAAKFSVQNAARLVLGGVSATREQVAQ